MNYYIPRGTVLKNKLIPMFNINRMKHDENKYVVVPVDYEYHVLVMQHGEYEEEKRVYDYDELVSFLSENKLNTYFIGFANETAKLIHYDIYKRDNKGFTLPKTILEGENIYTVYGDKLLRVKATADKNVIREALLEEYSKEENMQIELTDFYQDEEVFKSYYLPFRRIGDDKISVPVYSYTTPTLFYTLSEIYSRKRDEDAIQLTEDDLWNLYAATNSRSRDIIEKVADSIKVTIEEEYDLKKLKDSVEVLSNYSNKEQLYNTRLKSITKTITSAEENEELFNNMYLIKDNSAPVLTRKKDQ